MDRDPASQLKLQLRRQVFICPKLLRAFFGVLLLSASLFAAGCTGTKGGGFSVSGGSPGTTSLVSCPVSATVLKQVPRCQDTGFTAAGEFEWAFGRVGYDWNVGEPGSGVTVAVFDSGIRANHPTISGRVSNPLAITSSRDGDQLDHGTFVAMLAAGGIGTEAYGIAYRSPVEFVCCIETEEDETAAAITHLGASSQAFVINNSWSVPDEMDVRNADRTNCHRVSVRIGPTDQGCFSSRFEFDAPISRTFTSAEVEVYLDMCAEPANGVERMCVFSAGNEGFQPEGYVVAPGNVVAFWVRDLLDPDRSPLSEAGRNTLESRLMVRGQFLNLPAEDPRFDGHSIVAVALEGDTDNLADYSNQCGASMMHCLAAPGDYAHYVCDTAENGLCMLPPGEEAEGTSFAAPLVLGAAALLKSTYPNLSPPNVVSLLLTTATDIGEDGPDAVFGMGRMNVAESIAPQGPMTSAAGETLAETAVGIGPALDAAFAKSGATFGMFDMYRRPYLHSVAGRASRRGSDSPSDMLSAAGRRMEMGLSRRMGLADTGNGRLERAAERWRDGMVGFASGLETCAQRCDLRGTNMASSLVPSSSLAWQELRMQTDFGSIGLAAEAGLDGDSAPSFAGGKMFLAKDYGESLLRLEAGLLDESDTFMGSEFGGALAVGEGRGRYLSARLGTRVGEGALSASYTSGRESPGTSFGSYVAEVTPVAYDGYRLAYGADDWELHYTVPLAATGGGMRIESVGGYTGAKGDWSIVSDGNGVAVAGKPSPDGWEYRTDSHWIDFGAGERERRLGLAVTEPLGAWDVLLAVEHVSNSPRRSFAGDEVRAAVEFSLLGD